MENKKGSLSTVFLIIAIILIGVMGVFMYMQKTEAVMTANERYSTYINGLKNNLNKIQENSHISVNSGEHMTLSNAGINSYITIENNGDAYLGLEKDGKLGKKYGEKYKVATKIVNAGIQVYGQDASVLLWFINELGEFSYIDISDVNIENLEIKTIKDLKNIVDVTIKYNGEANIPVAIDIEGNLLEVKF